MTSESTQLLHYDLPGSGGVLSYAFSDHLCEVATEHVPVILSDPRWRLATDGERQAFYAPAQAETPSETPRRRTRTRKAN